MNAPNIDDLWTRFLSGQLSGADEALLVTALGLHAELRDEALLDAEMDGLLRTLGKANQRGDEQRFVTSVLEMLETDGAVAPPPVTQSPEKPPIDDASDVAPPPIVNLARQTDIAAVETSPRTDRFNARIVWSAVAAMAATLLIALIVINRGDSDKTLAVSHPESSLPISTDRSDELEATRPTFAESDPRIDSHPKNPPDEVEESVPAPNRVELVEDASGPQILKADPERSPIESTETLMSGFAVLVRSSEDALWYETPRELTGQSLNLKSGTAEFRLASGTMISVRGPSHFQIDSPNSLILATGVVAADVPEQAIGFAIDTPSARVVDLGTQFDVRVTPSGAMLVSVRKGAVAVKSAADESAADESDGIILQKGNRKFIEADGAAWDWKVEITANIFGELSGTINGHSFKANSLETLHALATEISDDQAVSRGRNDPTVRGCYIFNGRVQGSEQRVSASELLKLIEQDLSRCEDVIREAEDDSGAYRVKNRLFVYGNLKEKLQARRNVARIYGPRALGEHFAEHEKFETTGDADKLFELQSKLNKRLDFINVRNVPGLPRSKISRDRIQQPQSVGEDNVTVVKPHEDGSSGPLQATASQRVAERKQSFRLLEEIRRRKERFQHPAPAESEPEDDAEAANISDGVETPEDDPAGVKPVEPAADEKAIKTDGVTAKPTPKRRSAARSNPELDAIVAAALEAELQGDQNKRQELLNQTLTKYEGHPTANWQLGKVKVGRQWLPLEQAQERAKTSPVVASFQRLREEYEGSAEGELKLARWCKSRRPETARMYYARLLSNPKVTNAAVRAEAAENLDLVPYRGAYVTRDELKQQAERQEAWRDANRRWNKPLAKWAKWLRPESTPEQKELAIQEMEQANDPGLVLAANQFATAGSEEFGVQLVNTVHQYPRPESSHLLCNIAMNTSRPVVRPAAVTARQQRKLHDYVPGLLGSLVGSVHSDWNIVRQEDGTIRYEHVVRQEGATNNRELVTVREAKPVTLSDRQIQQAGFAVEPLLRAGLGSPAERAVAQERPILFGFRWSERRMLRRTGQDNAITNAMSKSAAEREQRVALENHRVDAYNDRIFRLLSATTEQELPPDPPQWWNWWTDYNEIELEKPTQRNYDYDEIQFVNRTYGIGLVRERHSCFAAGTPVATETGMRPIEQIVAGDRVYAKNVNTGELRLQTVLTTTIRQSETIVELTLGKTKLRTTPGHPFWVADEGWRMAKLLAEGDQLHGVGGGMIVEQIRTQVGAPVFNLIVDQFHNYLVGDAMVMAHDHTFRAPTGVRLPGLP